jgi:hypothetical protein
MRKAKQPKVDDKLVKKWIKALRSGEYKQGRLVLRERNIVNGETTYRHCCLGVLADLMKVQWETDHFGRIGFSEEGGIYITKLPPGYLPKAVMEDLMNMNDNFISFYRIADRIEGLHKRGELLVPIVSSEEEHDQ